VWVWMGVGVGVGDLALFTICFEGARSQRVFDQEEGKLLLWLWR